MAPPAGGEPGQLPRGQEGSDRMWSSAGTAAAAHGRANQARRRGMVAGAQVMAAPQPEDWPLCRPATGKQRPVQSPGSAMSVAPARIEVPQPTTHHPARTPPPAPAPLTRPSRFTRRVQRETKDSIAVGRLPGCRRRSVGALRVGGALRRLWTSQNAAREMPANERRGILPVRARSARPRRRIFWQAGTNGERASARRPSTGLNWTPI